jgi:predicted transcriptional regulator of viral defense system
LQQVERLTGPPAARYNSSAFNHECRGIVTDSTPPDRALELLEGLGSVRSRDLERAGVSRTQIRRLLEQGRIERVGRGLYRRPGAPLSERQDLAEIARRVPGGVVCLLSALRFHGLTTQNPFEVWLAGAAPRWTG